MWTNHGGQRGRGQPKSRRVDGVEEDTKKLRCGNRPADDYDDDDDDDDNDDDDDDDVHRRERSTLQRLLIHYVPNGRRSYRESSTEVEGQRVRPLDLLLERMLMEMIYFDFVSC